MQANITNSPRPPTAAVLIIGAEVLSAKVQDQNGPFLLSALRGRGIEVSEIRTIADKIPEIAAAVRELSPRVGHLITAGGIGPTHDDVTMAGIAAGLNVPLCRDGLLEARLREYSPDDINEARLKMADVPKGAKVTLEPGDPAPLVQVANIAILPGVPFALRQLWPRLAPQISGPPFFSAVIHLSVRETTIAAHLTAVQQKFTHVAIGSYPELRGAKWRVKVTVDGRDEQDVLSAATALRDGFDPDWFDADSLIQQAKRP